MYPETRYNQSELRIDRSFIVFKEIREWEYSMLRIHKELVLDFLLKTFQKPSFFMKREHNIL